LPQRFIGSCERLRISPQWEMRYGPKVKKSIDRVIEPTDGLGGISSFTPAACSDTPWPPRQLGPRSLFQSAYRGDARSSAECQDRLGPIEIIGVSCIGRFEPIRRVVRRQIDILRAIGEDCIPRRQPRLDTGIVSTVGSERPVFPGKSEMTGSNQLPRLRSLRPKGGGSMSARVHRSRRISSSSCSAL
jgi:hypothetical protein